MKAIKILLVAILCSICNMAIAENEISDNEIVKKLEQRVQQLDESMNKYVSSTTETCDQLKKRVKQQETEIKTQNAIIQSQAVAIDSLKSAISHNATTIKATADTIDGKIVETNKSLKAKADSSDVSTKTGWGVFFIVMLLILGGIFFFLLHKRINKGTENVNALKQKAEQLNEEILNQFSQEMAEMKKISSILSAIEEHHDSNTPEVSGKSSEPDHSLIKTIADRITFIEMTLYKMDPNVRGYKQLSRSISQMKDNLRANGYEIVEMLGKPYNDGMKVTANFKEDDTLEKGKQIITGIIKPQINYKGVMIQSAQITVSQN